MTRLIIGLCGPMGCGKSTVADRLHSHHGFAAPMAMADPLKDAACAILGVDRVRLEELKRSDSLVYPFVTVRYLLQTLGTEWGRKIIHPDMWLISIRRLIERTPGDARICIADIRFENERQLIYDMDGIIVHIQRPGHEHSLAHVSEAGLKRKVQDHVVINDGDRSRLYGAIDAVLTVVQPCP